MTPRFTPEDLRQAAKQMKWTGRFGHSPTTTMLMLLQAAEDAEIVNSISKEAIVKKRHADADPTFIAGRDLGDEQP